MTTLNHTPHPYVAPFPPATDQWLFTGLCWQTFLEYTEGYGRSLERYSLWMGFREMNMMGCEAGEKSHSCFLVTVATFMSSWYPVSPSSHFPSCSPSPTPICAKGSQGERSLPPSPSETSVSVICSQHFMVPVLGGSSVHLAPWPSHLGSGTSFGRYPGSRRELYQAREGSGTWIQLFCWF